MQPRSIPSAILGLQRPPAAQVGGCPAGTANAGSNGRQAACSPADRIPAVTDSSELLSRPAQRTRTGGSAAGRAQGRP